MRQHISYFFAQCKQPFIRKHLITLAALFLALFYARLYALFNAGLLFYQFEGLRSGWLGKELLDGAGWWDIFTHPYIAGQGGATVISFLAALSFAVFGDNFFSLALVPILFAALILMLFYIFLCRYFTYYSAVIFTFLFIFAPQEYLIFSLQGIGSHFESTLFNVLGFFCFFEIFFKRANYEKYLMDAPTLNRLFITFGAISGFGVYFCYDYIIVLFTMTIFWAFIDKKFFLRKCFCIFLLGFIAGFLPWLIYYIVIFSAHELQKLNICGFALSDIIFSKTIPQIVKTLEYITTVQLPLQLEWKFYSIIVLSFFSLSILSFPPFRKRMHKLLPGEDRDFLRKKEGILISYVAIFILVWSILYLPLSKEQPVWSSGLSGRLFNIHPFLFVLVGLYAAEFLPPQNWKWTFSKIIFSLGLLVLILNIGFSNYLDLVQIAGKKMNPFKIKGYSMRLLYQEGKGKYAGFLNKDMANIIPATRNDKRLWEVFSFSTHVSSLYSPNGSLEKILNDLSPNSAKTAYYYFLIGVNTGDYTSGYDILGLNKLIDERIPPECKHYVYEGVAFSLMNRRPKEVIKNLDFINSVPKKYRHYFALGLGQALGKYYGFRIEQRNLQHIISKFSPVNERYIYQGLICYLTNTGMDNEFSSGLFPAWLKEKHSLYFYFNLLSRDDPSRLIKQIYYEETKEKYFYDGIIAGLFKNDDAYGKSAIADKLNRVICHDRVNEKILCIGLGFNLGFLTFGHIREFRGDIECLLNDIELSAFYTGYYISLKERYGADLNRIKKIAADNIPVRFRDLCY